MGTITNKFICVEMVVFEMKEIDEIQELVALNDFASVRFGSNSYVYVTVTPSGSKNGWSTERTHRESTSHLISKLQQIDPSCVVKTVTTSTG